MAISSSASDDKVYLIDANGTFKLARSLVERARKENKKGVTVMAEMSSFLTDNKIKELIEYESSLPINMRTISEDIAFSSRVTLSSTQNDTPLNTHDEPRKIQS